MARFNLIEIAPGTVFGQWTVIRRGENNPQGTARYLVKCTCGNERLVASQSLRNKTSSKCRPCALKFKLEGKKLFRQMFRNRLSKIGAWIDPKHDGQDYVTGFLSGEDDSL